MEYEGFQIQARKGSVLYEIKAKGRGSVVKALRGAYTSLTEAKQAIAVYLLTKNSQAKE